MNFTNFINMFDPTVILGLKVSLAFIGLDAFLGWFVAAKNLEFDFRKVPQFLKTNIFPYFGTLILLAFATLVDPETFIVLFGAASGLISAKFGIEALKDKLTKLF